MTIIIPRRMNETPVYFCTLCPKAYFQSEMSAYLKHCSTAHSREDLVEHSPALQAPALFGQEGGDRDWAAWVEKNRRERPSEAWKWMKTEAGKNSSGLGDG